MSILQYELSCLCRQSLKVAEPNYMYHGQLYVHLVQVCGVHAYMRSAHSALMCAHNALHSCVRARVCVHSVITQRGM